MSLFEKKLYTDTEIENLYNPSEQDHEVSKIFSAFNSTYSKNFNLRRFKNTNMTPSKQPPILTPP